MAPGSHPSSSPRGASASCSYLSLCGASEACSQGLAFRQCGLGLITIPGLVWVGAYHSLSLRLQGYRSRWLPIPGGTHG